MKNALVTMIATLLLGCAVLPMFAEADLNDQNGSSRHLASQTDNLTAAKQPQGIKEEWTEPVTTTVTISSTPQEETAEGKQRVRAPFHSTIKR